MQDMKALIDAIEDFSCCSGGCCGHPELELALKLAKELELEKDSEDDNISNMFVRAGYLFALAANSEGEDRLMLRQAARSLLYAAKALRALGG